MTLKEKYLKQAKTFHGDKYDYSLWPEVITCRDKVEIICPIHGKFIQPAINHANGAGCRKCCPRSCFRPAAMDRPGYSLIRRHPR